MGSWLRDGFLLKVYEPERLWCVCVCVFRLLDVGRCLLDVSLFALCGVYSGPWLMKQSGHHPDDDAADLNNALNIVAGLLQS